LSMNIERQTQSQTTRHRISPTHTHHTTAIDVSIAALVAD